MRTTFNVKGEPFCTVDLSPLGQDVLERASANLRKETGKKFIPGEMDFDELAEFGAECTRLITDHIEMTDGTRPILGKPPESVRKFFRDPKNAQLANGIAKEAKKLADAGRVEFEVASGN